MSRRSQFKYPKSTPASSCATAVSIRDGLSERIGGEFRTTSAKYVFAMACDLTRAKELLPHKRFGPWLKAKCPNITWRTANNYMSVHGAPWRGGAVAPVLPRFPALGARPTGSG